MNPDQNAPKKQSGLIMFAIYESRNNIHVKQKQYTCKASIAVNIRQALTGNRTRAAHYKTNALTTEPWCSCQRLSYV